MDGRRRIDLRGKVFGELTVIEPADNIDGRTAWLCRCSCGTTVTVKTKNLRNGKTWHCGCRRRYGIDNLHYIDGTCIEMIHPERLRSNNSSGCTGVFYDSSKRRWRAEIMFCGKRHCLGYFSHFEDARDARLSAEEKLYGAFFDRNGQEERREKA